MEYTEGIVNLNEEAVAMGLRNKVPELLAAKGWDSKTFAAYCMLAGVSADTAYRIARGETDVRIGTLEKVARVLGVASISDIIDLDSNQESQ